MTVDAVVLAGSLNNGQLREYSPVPYEAQIPIGSKTMVEYVLDALLKSSYVERMVIAGPGDLLPPGLDTGRVQVISPGSSVLENVQSGIDCLPSARRVLVVTSDIPLLTVQAVDGFLEQCTDQTVDLFYPVVSRDIMESRFAGVKRTYVRLREGIFTGGNLFLLNPVVLPRCLAKGKELVAARKNPWRLSRLIGITFLIKFLLRRLSLKEAEVKVSKLLGIKGVAVISQYPEIGFDVDKPADLEQVTGILSM
ncbi:MAG TPA: hypothetical protein DCM26_02615 [Desulfotomaculum sp.]|jgi:molybdopterin-guanine dinucleotide biosynthesis protein A|nr:hypothetical protein [Desulfotomaculum sp.]